MDLGIYDDWSIVACTVSNPDGISVKESSMHLMMEKKETRKKNFFILIFICGNFDDFQSIEGNDKNTFYTLNVGS